MEHPGGSCGGESGAATSAVMIAAIIAGRMRRWTNFGTARPEARPISVRLATDSGGAAGI